MSSMIKYTNNCIRCEVCSLGSSCPKLKELRIYCDDCGDEVIATADGRCKSCYQEYLRAELMEAFIEENYDSFIDFCNECFSLDKDNIC